MKKLFLLCLVLTVIFAGCNSNSNNRSVNGMVNINFNEYRQEIDGFGGSDAWLSLPPAAAVKLVNLLYSRTEGAGFTILRNRLPFRERLAEDDTPGHNDGFIIRNADNTYNYTENPDGTKTFNLNWNSWNLSSTRNLIRQIHALGDDGPERLVIMSTPWTTPNNRVTRWKEDVVGVSSNLDYVIDWSRPDVWGRLKRDHYNDYADLLADYALNFEDRMGAPLAILSVQNEPNWKVEYESTYWNGNDLRDFIKVIGSRFPMKGITVGPSGLGIMAPEYENFDVNFNTMIKPMLDDPESERVLTHIALHQYNAGYDSSNRAGAKEFPGIVASGKRFWQTEISGSGPRTPGGIGIENALYFARMIHFDFTLTQMNAFLYWWLWGQYSGEDFQGHLINVMGDNVTPAKRLFAMGQYSRFIRPGWFRIESDTAPAIGVYSSAYRNPNTKEIAIVLINERPVETILTLNLNDAEFNSLEYWRTSADEDIAPLGSQRVSRNTVNVTLAPNSITTYYGTVK